MKEDLNKIRDIEDKYGLMLFRMGLSHLVDVGHRHFDDVSVDKTIKRIIEKGEEDKANGEAAIMTPEFQCAVVRCAAELAQFSIWTLFVYIKKHVEVGNL